MKTCVSVMPPASEFTPRAVENARRLYDGCRARYGADPKLSLPAMVYPASEGFRTATKIDVRLTQNRSHTHFHLHSVVLNRLTSSLLKVGHRRNIELSQSFARLSNRISEESAVIKRRTDVSNLFTSTRSLRYLINALRRAFSGNNLQLRQNLVHLIRDIHEAGQTHTKERSEIHKYLLLYRLFEPSYNNHRTILTHRRRSVSDTVSDVNIQREVERAVAQLKTEQHAVPKPQDTGDIERMLDDFQRKLQRDQQETWRLEKLQRGLL